MIHVSPTLSPTTFFKSLFSSKKNYLQDIHQFSYVRGALIAAIFSIKKSKNLSSFPTVWAPAFICDTVFLLFESYGIPYKLYPITEDLLPDWKRVNHLNFKENDIFLLVYFFGFPMGIDEAKELCQTKELSLVEDCAHSIISHIKPDGIGTHGDAAVFGLRKALPLPHGGFLYMKKIPFERPHSVSESASIYRSPLKMLIQWAFCKLKLKWSKSTPPIKKGELSTFPDNYALFDFLEEMSPLSRKITNSIKIDNIIELRRNNYEIYHKSLKPIKEVRIPSTLNLENEQTTPWVFFFFSEQAEELINYLRCFNIPAIDFPTLHVPILNNEEFKFENSLYKQSVCLPVHQDIGKKEISFIIQKVKSFFS